MSNTITCEYCNYFQGSKIIRKNIEEFNNELKASIPKRCIATRRKMNIDTEACEYFDPAKYFYCAKNNFRVAVVQCMDRRRNESEFVGYEKCLKCRQFENFISSIAEKYWLQAKKVIPPKIQIQRRKKVESKITRRPKPDSEITRLRKHSNPPITRRDKPVKERKIKRRTKPKSKIKRR